jgi:hypothetical protein
MATSDQGHAGPRRRRARWHPAAPGTGRTSPRSGRHVRTPTGPASDASPTPPHPPPSDRPRRWPCSPPQTTTPGATTKQPAPTAASRPPRSRRARTANTTAAIPALRAPTTTTGTSVGRAVHTCSPVLLLIVARVLWTARPPARPALGAEATMAEPAGPMTFRCPLAVRSTCPPARCTAAAICFACLDRQRFGGRLLLQRHARVILSIPRTLQGLHRG